MYKFIKNLCNVIIFYLIFLILGIILFTSNNLKNTINQNKINKRTIKQNILLTELETFKKEMYKYIITLGVSQQYLSRGVQNNANSIIKQAGMIGKIYNKIIRPSYNKLKNSTVIIVGKLKEKNNEGTIKKSKILPYKKNDLEWSGTGVVIKVDDNYTYILTNAHVIGENKQNILELFVTESIKDDEDVIKYKLEVIKISQDFDLAIAKVKGIIKGKEVIKGYNIAKPQDKVYTVGHHLGRLYIYGEGVFAGYSDKYSLIQIPALFGCSGSGVFNQKGELIGLVFAVSTTKIQKLFPLVDTIHAVCVDGKDVKDFVDSVFKKLK